MGIVSIDLNVPLALASLPETVRAVLPEIAEQVRNEIVALAQRELHTGGADYVAGVHLLHVPLSATGMRRGEQTFATVTLTGWLANAIETGWAGGDMKPGLLGGRNVKIAKDGSRYAMIPFRHGTPGSSGRSFGAMGSAHRKKGMSRSDAEQLGRRIHRAAKKLAATSSHPRTGTAWGERLSAATARGAGSHKLTSHTGYRHKSDVHAGMTRHQKTYASATQNKYMTFRAVSDKSDPASWVHPGIVRHDFFGRIEKRVPAIAGLLLRGAIAGVNRESKASAGATI